MFFQVEQSPSGAPCSVSILGCNPVRRVRIPRIILEESSGLAGFRGFIVPGSLENSKSSCEPRGSSPWCSAQRRGDEPRGSPITGALIVAKKTSNGKSHEKTNPTLIL